MRLLYKTGAMESLRKWFYKPKRDDRSLLAQFFFADETLNMVAAELDSFDGREDPERCSTLVNQLRHAQEHVLNITGQIMDQLLGSERVARGFRVKFPEDVLQDNLAGQLWFGAECLAAGSSIMNREEESAAMRPLAKALTRSLETVRALLRDHCLRCNQHGATLHACSEILHESLKIFDRLFAEFELCYVSAMVPVKSPREFMVQQHICVLFSETLQRARRIGLLTQDQVDDYDPALMFAIPRLAIVSGLLIFSNGPLSIDKSPADQMSDMFRPFRTLLYKIRELLWTLDRRELYLLEKLLCTNEDIANIRSSVETSHNDGTLPMNMDGSCYPDISEFVTRFYSDFSHCKDMMVLNQMAGEWGAPSNSNALSSQLGKKIDDSASSINEGDYLPDNMEIFTPILDGMRRLNEISLMDDAVTNYPNESKIIKEAERATNSTVIDNDSNLQESSVDEPRVNAENQPAALHSSGDSEHHIKLNVEYVDSNDTNGETKDAEVSDALEESLTLTLMRMESRSSSRSLGSRKSSRNESSASGASHTSDFMIRNLSSNGLSMFDPLAASSTCTININPVASDNNVLLPDQLLVSNLSEQVSEIADKLSSISYENSDNTVCLMDTSISNLLQDQMYSFSTNDVSNLVSDRESSMNFPITRDNVNFSPGRSEKVLSQLANMPSTSHGYLIPNAIGQEPAILTSLSNNNSVIFDEDPLLNPINNPMMMSQQSVNLANMESEMFGDSISVANANLSSLLLTSDEFQNRFLPHGTSEIDVLADKPQDETFASATSNYNEASFYSAVDVVASEKAIDYSGQNSTGARARFLIGYESDSNEPTPGDSGICTENTSLDRSPDSEVKDLNNTSNSKECITVRNANDQDPDDRCNLRIETCYNHYMDLNCSLSNENDSNKSLIDAPPPNRLRSSFSSNGKGGVTINITDCPTDGTPRIINSLRLNYSENSRSMQKNEAGPSHCIMQSPEFVSSLSGDIENSDISCNDIELSNGEKTIAIADLPEVINNYCDINLCSDNFDEGKAAPNEDTNLARATDSSILDSDVNDNCSIKNDNCDSNVSVLDSVNDIDAYRTENAVVESSANLETICTEAETSLNSNATIVNEASSSESVENNNVSVGVLNQRKLKKSPKIKKKGSRKSKLWSPGQGTGDSKGSEQPSPMRLNLEQLVDQGGGSCSSQSSVTSSFHSECADDEEIALALQAQEFASRHCTRAKFRSSEDLIHRLFVCIAGVADQLQTNFASDLRNILKSVFLMNQTPEIEEPEPVEEEPETKEPVDGESSTSRKNKSSDTIEYEVSESEVLTNGDSFDSIYLAEEVYADNIDNATNNNSPTSQRSLQSSRLSQTGATEDAQNDLNQRRNSQSGRRHPRNSSDSRTPSRRNTINTVLVETRRRIQSSTEELNRDSRLSDGDSDTVDRINANEDDNRTCFIDNGGSTRSSSSDSSHAPENPQQDQSRDIEKDPDSSNLTTEETVTIYRLNPQLSDDPVPLEHSPRLGRNNVNSRDARGLSGDNTNLRDRSVRSQSVCGNTVERAPEWVPDIAAPDCMRCGSHFTAFRRRHHCRNCGKVFCASCSANSVPLPRFGQMKPVRVCEECFQTLAKRSCAARQIIPGTQSGRHANYTHR